MAVEQCEATVKGEVPGMPPGGDSWLRTAAARQCAMVAAEWARAPHGPDEAPDEQTLFLALRACAYRARAHDGDGPVGSAGQQEWVLRQRVIRDYVVEQHLGLAYAMIRRFKYSQPEHDDLVSDALFALARAIERFDPWQGCRFSTYACTTIVRALINRSKHGLQHRRRFPYQHDASFEVAEKVDTQTELYVERLHRALDANLGDLDGLEAQVLAQRYPLDHEPQSTLSAIGRAVGLSKERVRQIQNAALRKLRAVLVADPVLR
jgi:RNA polymerase primary sigma factor